MDDKATQVRKYAIQLLSTLLVYNPFSADLRLSEFTKKLEEAERQLKAKLDKENEMKKPKEKKAAPKKKTEPPKKAEASKKKAAQKKKDDKKKKKKGDEESDEELLSEEEGEQEKQEDSDEEILLDSEEEGEGEEEEQGEEEELLDAGSDEEAEEKSEEVKKLEKIVKFYEDGVQFIAKIHKAIPIVGTLLGSKVNADVQEAIQFFVTANEFKIENAAEGIKKMLVLVWSKEVSTKEAVIDAYSKLYMTPPQTLADPKLGDIYIANNFVRLALSASTTEITSLEELITLLVAKQLFPASTVKCLWDFFSTHFFFLFFPSPSLPSSPFHPQSLPVPFHSLISLYSIIST